MARSYATVGQMITFAYEQVLRSRPAEAREDSELMFTALTAFCLEYVTMSPRSRDAFVRVMLGEDVELGNVVANESGDSGRADLSARILPADGEEDDGAVLLIALGIGAPVPSSRVTRLQMRLGSSSRSRLLLINRKADRVGAKHRDDPRVLEATWEKTRGKLAREDSGHAELWTGLGDIGLTAGLPVAQLPVSPHKLLTSKQVAREFRGHLDVFHRACRAALAISPRFSTHAGERYAVLQAGDSRGRWGLRFNAVFKGTPTIVVRGGEVLHPLGIAMPEDDEDRAEEKALLDRLRRRPGDRTGRAPKHRPMIGAPASPEMEAVRRLLWSVWNPLLLAERGFELAPARRQPALTATTLALRLVRPEDPVGISYLVSVGGDRDWSSLVPRVTREEHEDLPAEEYAVAPRKNWSSAEFVWEVHRALYSLTIPVRSLRKG